jgi:hypothetical protein
MKIAGIAAMVAAAILMMASLDAIASMGKGSGGWGIGGNYSRMYDPARVETISGEVVSIDEFSPMSGMSNGIHITLRPKRRPFQCT